MYDKNHYNKKKKKLWLKSLIAATKRIEMTIYGFQSKAEGKKERNIGN